MTSIYAPIAEPGVVADERRRLAMLQRIAALGGKITPSANPKAEYGYEYLEPLDGCEGDLRFLARRDYLEQRFFDRVSLCPKCSSHHLNVREVCPGCRRAHLAREGLLHHFRCGYVGILSEFAAREDGGRVCPKCNRELHHLGTEYDRLGKAFICRQCGLITENPPVEAVCFACGARTPAEDLLNTEVFSYVLTSLGSAALRRGSLLDADNDFLFVDGPKVYRRSVILELLDHEMERIRHFRTEFSVLLAEYTRGAMDGGEGSPASCAARLRQCLREVDLVGQLTDTLFIVMLPHTKHRAAEALRQRILAELGLQLPFTLSTTEITESRQLAQLLARANVEREPK
jgi:hypothetical protein